MNHYSKSPTDPKIWAIMPAAGIGKRMAQSRPKQYLIIDGKTVIEHSLDKLLNNDRLSGIAIGIAGDDPYWEKLELKHEKLLGAYAGGQERIHTVLNGLDYLSAWTEDNDWVMVHDAVRPCLSSIDVSTLIEKGLSHESGAILGSPVFDTVKKVSADRQIVSTVNRDELMLAMTPQLFPIALLNKALQFALEQNQISTDEAGAVEYLGQHPLMVEGRRSNIKITTFEDLKAAQIFLQQYK